MRIALSQLARCVHGILPLRRRAMCVQIAQKLPETPAHKSVLRRMVVLLLVLVCMTAGCARSTAQPQPQTSSPRARQSTPPRSKAKAPVATVRPKAPPQPAPPQPGEEQGGRVF